MARAQTYIITIDNLYSYTSELHDDNHNNHMKMFYSNLKITEYIPFLLTNNFSCVLDISKHDKFGTIFLPDKMSEFQQNLLLSREVYLSNFKWYLSNVEGKRKKYYEDIKFKDIVPLIKIKKQL